MTENYTRMKNGRLETVKRKGSADKLDCYVAARFKKLCTLKGKTQEYIAGQVGLTFQQIQKNQNGTNRISASRLYQFSQILDVPVTYFYEGYSDDEEADPYEIPTDTLRFAGKLQRLAKLNQPLSALCKYNITKCLELAAENE